MHDAAGAPAKEGIPETEPDSYHIHPDLQKWLTDGAEKQDLVLHKRVCDEHKVGHLAICPAEACATVKRPPSARLETVPTLSQNYWSTTFRSAKATTIQGENEVGMDLERLVNEFTCAYQPSQKLGDFVFSVLQLCQAIIANSPSIIDPTLPGLVVVTGQTSVAKSQILRGLVHRYLLGISHRKLMDKWEKLKPEDPKNQLMSWNRAVQSSCRENKWDDLSLFDDGSLLSSMLIQMATKKSDCIDRIRKQRSFDSAIEEHKKIRPLKHLLLFENPIEALFFRQSAGLEQYLCPVVTQALGLDITFRSDADLATKPDACSLAMALEGSALRQKPYGVVVGECRTKDELKACLDFAGTGHRVFTTFHAGSLQESMGKLLASQEAQDPSKRGELAGRILAVIHLRAEESRAWGVDPTTKKIALPAVWSGSSSAIDALVRDGLRSLVPERSREFSLNRAMYGRAFFADWLISKEQKSDLHASVVEHALWWDMVER